MLRFLVSFAGTAGIRGEFAVKRSEYVDFNSFSYLVPGGRSWFALTLIACASLGFVIWLVMLLYKSANADNATQNLAWATTLTWTLVLNVYVPVYDTLLIAVAVTLTIGALKQINGMNATVWVAVLAIGISAVSLNAENIAQNHEIQPLTPLILLLGLVQAIALQGVVRKKELSEDLAVSLK